MAESIKVELTAQELNTLARDIAETFEADASFFSAAPALDDARVMGYLRLEHARVLAGTSKGFDLRLPPWASKVLLTHLFPAKAKAAKATLPAKSAKKAHTPRKKRPSELREEAARREADRPLPGMSLAHDYRDDPDHVE